VIRRLARRGAGSALHRALEKAKAVDIASAIGHLAPAEQRLVLSHISTDELAAEVLVRVEPDELRTLARDLAFERLVKLLNAMDADDEADVIDRLPDDLRARVLGAITPEDKVLVEDILAWPEDSAGGIMQLAVIGNHRWKSEKTTLGGDELQEFGGQA
jgi:magnesium transporter